MSKSFASYNQLFKAEAFKTYLLRSTCVSLLWKSEASAEKFFTAENKAS
jgi:hypothetical protein